MGDDVQIVSVTNPTRSRRKRKPAADDVELLFVESLPYIDVPEITHVELPPDDSVAITGFSEATENIKSSDDGVADRVENWSDKTRSGKKRKQTEPELPAYWTKCEKCGSYERRYHLIEVPGSTHEWLNVCAAFLNQGFLVQRLARIQNQALWLRLQSERQLMCRSHVAGFDLNERLLYHTSRATPQVICSEGLDQRLGAVGNFGRGIYFGDNPRKCDMYWKCHSNTPTRKMFACRVLLGDIKVYPSGKCDNSLVREPPKSTRGRLTSETYDSVMGNIGFNEFVVYNAYRVMPEYVVEYQTSPIPPQIAEVSPKNPHSSRPSLPMCHMCGKLTTICRCCVSN